MGEKNIPKSRDEIKREIKSYQSEDEIKREERYYELARKSLNRKITPIEVEEIGTLDAKVQLDWDNQCQRAGHHLDEALWDNDYRNMRTLWICHHCNVIYRRPYEKGDENKTPILPDTRTSINNVQFTI